MVSLSLQCQGSSTANPLRGEGDRRHDTGERMLAVAIACGPSLILIETVVGFLTVTSRFNAVVDMLGDAHYNVSWYTINANRFVPTSRPRLFIVASRQTTDHLGDLYDRLSCAPVVPLSTMFKQAAFWCPIRRNGMGPRGQPCIIGSDRDMPCITTKCCRRPPARYIRHPRDHLTPVADCYQLQPRDILQLLGFPRTWLTEGEIDAQRCRCPVCDGHRSTQIGRVLGRVWSPPVAEAIAECLIEPCIRLRRARLDACDDAPSPSAYKVGQIVSGLMMHHQQNTPVYVSLADETASSINLSENILRQYVRRQEEKLGTDIRMLPEPEVYDMNDIVIGEKATAKSRARIAKLLKTYKPAFAVSDQTLPDPVCTSDGTPIEIHLAFKPGAKPVKCRQPKTTPGTARWKILEAFRIEYEAKGLLVADYKVAWANRPHLVAKFKSEDTREGIPDSIRFTADMSVTNDQLELLPAVHADVANELLRTGGHRWYCQADSQKAYWSYLLSPESSEACSVWLPCDGQWRLYRFVRMMMGARNSATHMQNGYMDFARGCLNLKTFSNLADDWVFWDSDGTQDSCLDNFEAFLAMCVLHNMLLKPAKVSILVESVEYYGWKIDSNGRSPAKRNLEPVQRLVEPTSFLALKTILGMFVQFRHFLTDSVTIKPPAANAGEVRPRFYKELIHHISEKVVRARCPSDFSKAWGPEQSAAFQRIKSLLLKGVHLHVPLNDRSYHMTTDMSEFGMGVYLFQVADDGSKRTVMMFNKPWTRTDIIMPAPHKEGNAWSLGFQWCLPYVIAHGHPFFTYNDSLPVSSYKHASARTAFSKFILDTFNAVEWYLQYIEGPRNIEADALSRPPMLGELLPSFEGILTMLHAALALLPLVNSYRRIYCYADYDTQHVLNAVRQWRTTPGRTFTEGLAKVSPQIRADRKITPIDYDLAICFPPLHLGSALCGDLLRAGKPFVCMVASSFLIDVPLLRTGLHTQTYDPATRDLLAATSRLIYSHAGFTVVVGGLTGDPVHRQFNTVPCAPREISLHPSTFAKEDFYFDIDDDVPSLDNDFAVTTSLAFKCACCYADNLKLDLPGLGLMHAGTEVDSVDKWTDEQAEERSEFSSDDKKRLHTRKTDNVLLYVADDEFGRVVVPASRRTPLVRTCHERMCHLGSAKVYAHLRKFYWFPRMRKFIEALVAACPDCQLAKSYQRYAHQLWSSTPYGAPRTQWGFDLKGVHPSDDGCDNIGVFIDLVTTRLILFACRTRASTILAQCTLDKLISECGPPMAVRSDHAKELISRTMRDFWAHYGTTRTTTYSYHATGNSAAERAMRMLNVSLRLLSDEQYRHWPKYLSTFQASWNHTYNERLGCTPFEADCGLPPRSPESILSLPDVPPPAATSDPADMITAIRRSAKAFANAAARNAAYYKRLRLEELNASGTTQTFAVGDRVMIYKPPSAAEAQRRQRKAKHMKWYTGNCVVTSVNKHATTGKPIGYVVRSPDGTVFERSVQNVRPYDDSAKADAQDRDDVSPSPSPSPVATPSGPSLEPPPPNTAFFSVGDFFIALDHPTSRHWWLHKVISLTDDKLTTRIHGTRGGQSKTAKFQPVFADHKADVLTTRLPRGNHNFEPWTQIFLPHHLPIDVKVTNVQLDARGRLTAPSYAAVLKLPGGLVHATLRADMSEILRLNVTTPSRLPLSTSTISSP